jgi:N-acetylglucosaminyldiphosphoundecaprenol N-acetyl-beta-D-mannosaminyltransferase
MDIQGAEAKSIINQINSFKPNILLVGMGMGRQESWIYDNLSELDVNFIATTGACMELISGKIPIAPRWIGKIGMEWLFLLIKNPKRGFRRYLIEPFSLVFLLINKWISSFFSIK